MGIEQTDTEVAETVAGVVRHLRRVAELAWMQADAAGPRSPLLAANGSDDLNSQLAAADVEIITGQVEAAFARLIRLVKRSSGDERNQARVRLLEHFEALGNSDERVLKGRRDLMTALF